MSIHRTVSPRAAQVMISKGGRMVFEVVADYSSRLRSWTDVVRIWAVESDHDRVPAVIDHVKESHRRGKHARKQLKLRTLDQQPTTDDGLRVPRQYTEIGSATEQPIQVATHASTHTCGRARTHARTHAPSVTLPSST